MSSARLRVLSLVSASVVLAACAGTGGGGAMSAKSSTGIPLGATGAHPVQPLPDKPLKRRDLLRDGGLRIAEPLGGAAERALGRDCLQGRKVAQIDDKPAIRFKEEHDTLPEVR